MSFASPTRMTAASTCPSSAIPTGRRRPAANRAIPNIDCEQVIAQVFTSGSTGVPEPHVKRWGSLVRNVRAEAERLGVTRGHAILGTVPAQHMYGLESTVLMPLQSGASPACHTPLLSGRHLRGAGGPAPTACAGHDALPPAGPAGGVGRRADRRPAAVRHRPPVRETWRSRPRPVSRPPCSRFTAAPRPARLLPDAPPSGAAWQTFSGVRLRCEGETVWAEGGHIKAPTRLNDVIELVDADPTRFLLHGRHADLVNIAGKRTSLGYLNYQLSAIAGVLDGVFLLPPEGDDHAAGGVRRLIALVVAPELTPAALMQALRERIDPVFLPRPLLFVDALPRNAAGKLPDHASAGGVWRACGHQRQLASRHDGPEPAAVRGAPITRPTPVISPASPSCPARCCWTRPCMPWPHGRDSRPPSVRSSRRSFPARSGRGRPCASTMPQPQRAFIRFEVMAGERRGGQRRLCLRQRLVLEGEAS